MKWEYVSAYYDLNNTTKLTAWLNQMDGLGWELLLLDKDLFIFRRPVQAES